jgi:methylated-DNA-[protein]-cysteine S-methyltransferase
MMPFTFTTYESPIGTLTLIGDADALRRLHFPGHPASLDAGGRAPEQFGTATDQLDEYFAGHRQAFDLNLDPTGTPFRRRVWEAVRQIPYGSTTTYGGLARLLGSSSGGRAPEPRAVAAAIARTPIPIVIPCHRVLSADGSLTGYLGGLRRKRALLAFEAAGGDQSTLAATWTQGQLALL